MKIVALSFLLLIGSGTGQEKESKASLKETVAWMANFTNTHGFMMLNGVLGQTANISEVEGCTVRFERSYPQSKTAKQMKHEAADIALGDLDPDKVTMQTSHSEGGDTFEVDFERSDAVQRIVSEIEFGNGSKTKGYNASFYLFMDSADSAKRLGAALAHAIRLCGGKPAPF